MKIVSLIALSLLAFYPAASQADILCKNKKSAATFARLKCKKNELPIASVAISSLSTAAAAGDSIASSITLEDKGPTSGGTDTNTALNLDVTRLNASGGTLTNTGLNVSVIGDGGGDSTNVGLFVSTSGADANYSAIFQGGNVGIGVSDPDEQLELVGRLHLGQRSAPGVVTDKLYNVAGKLFWNGGDLGAGSESSSDISSIIAGNGISGGGSSGAVTLNINSGTNANQVVVLNSSAALPAVSGANLSALNANSLSAGTVADDRLSSNVSLLGASIGLGSEVSGTLPISNGGTGAASLNDLIALGNNTTGDYVASVTTSGGITGGASGGEGSVLALSIDQSFSPTWSGIQSFTGAVNIGTTTASVEALHL